VSRKTRSAPVGIVVIGAGVMGGFHAESAAELKEAAVIGRSGKAVALSA